MQTHGRRAFGLSLLAVLGLMVFTATTAQALSLEDGGKAGLFQILGSSALVAGAIGAGGQEGFQKLLVAGRNLYIECFNTVLQNLKFLSDTEGLVSLLFQGCKPFVHKTGAPVEGCSLPSEQFTATARFLAKKHESKPYFLFEADPPATSLGIIEFKSGTGCPLPLKNELKGSVVAEASAGEQKIQLLTFSEAIQKLFQVGFLSPVGDKLSFGTFEAFLNGSWTMSLLGTHGNCTFGIV